jgi:cytochrome P450
VFYAADLDMWVVSRYADIEAIFTDPATFSAAIAQDPVFPLADEARTTLREGGVRAGRRSPTATRPSTPGSDAFCLGAPLARMELRIVLELLSEHAPDLAMVGDQDLSFPPNVAFRGPRRLLLERTTA